MNYSSQLSRFLQQRVTLDLYGRSTVWGKLVYVAKDHLRLLDTVIVGDLEGHGWFEQSQFGDEDGGGPRNPETIIRIQSVVQVTCLEEPTESAPIADEPTSVDDSDSSSDGMILSLMELAEGLRSARGGETRSRHDDDTEAITVPLPSAHQSLVPEDRLVIEIGFRLIPLAAPDGEQDLVERIAALRKELAAKCGVVLPRVRIRDNARIDPSSYRILIDGHVVAQSELMMGRLLALNADLASGQIDGERTIEPAFDLEAIWIDPSAEELAIEAGCTVCSPVTVLITHLAETLKSRFHELLSHQDVLDRVRELRELYPEAIDALVPCRVSVPVLHRLLQRLLEERVAINQMMRIIESVAYHVDLVVDHEQILQRLREDIGRSICAALLDSDASLRAINIGETAERELASMSLESPDLSQTDLVRQIADCLESTSSAPVLLVQRPEIRPLLFAAITQLGIRAHVLARGEVPHDVRVSTIEFDSLGEPETPHAVLPR